MSTARTILVTGANQGLGMHAVHQLAKTPDVLTFMGSRKIAAAEEARAKFASDIHSSSSVVPVQLDITDATSIANAHAFISDYLKEKNLPGLDVLVNNAAIVGKSFEDTFATNVAGTAAVTEAFLPLLNKPGGAIINVSSRLGSNTLFAQKASNPAYPAYSSSKAALNSLTTQWAMLESQKGSGIRVISVCHILLGFNATNLNRYTGTGNPADGAQVIVKEALAKEGKTAVFVHKDGEYPW
ncbi:putative carbonyl reductase [Mycena maculata]|uniref:Carbonyl reductase n=1 Tax=Mycena maculata TaxID=230809 RepID=A0AAD7NF57_9AGAR|nr:putative carbonyl reductase [Mycena maculata]